MLQVLQSSDPVRSNAFVLRERIRTRRLARAKQRRRVIEMAVVRVFNMDDERLMALGRADTEAILARQIAMYIAHTSCAMSLTDIACLYARDRTTVAHACATIEDRREDPAFDRALDLLEWAVPHMATRHVKFLIGV